MHLVQRHDVLQRQAPVAGQHAGVVHVQHLAGQRQLHPVARQVIGRHREKALPLEHEQLADAAARRVHHLQVEHGRGQKSVAVVLLGRVLHHHALHIAGHEAALVGEAQALFSLHHVDAAGQGVVLVRDAVVQRLTDRIRLVLVNLLREQRALTDVAVLEVADLGVHLVHRQQQRHAEHGVVPVVTRVVFEQPPDFGLGRQQEVFGLFPAQQQQRCPSLLALDRQLGLVQKGQVIPRIDLARLVREFALVVAARNRQRFVVQIGQAGLRHGDRTPILHRRLGTDALDLFEVQRAQGRPISPVVVPVKRHRQAPGRGRDLQQQHAQPVGHHLMDLDKADPVCGAIGNIFLQVVQVFAYRPKGRAHHLPLVVHAKHQPPCGHTLQVRLVAKRREVPAQLAEVIAVLGLLELHHLVLSRKRQQAVQLGVDVQAHVLSPPTSGWGSSAITSKASSWKDLHSAA